MKQDEERLSYYLLFFSSYLANGAPRGTRRGPGLCLGPSTQAREIIHGFIWNNQSQNKNTSLIFEVWIIYFLAIYRSSFCLKRLYAAAGIDVDESAETSVVPERVH